MMDEKKKAKDAYDSIVKENLDKILEGKIDDVRDPDEKSKYHIEIDELSILLGQDGLCSIKRIKEFSKNKEEQRDAYELIRKDMFGVLFWPAYAVSINTLRSVKYKDRIDLLLNDIRKFYEIVKNDTELTIDIMKKIWTDCELARAYIYPNTFYWLRSFGNFNNFITKDGRDISCFVPEGQSWQNTGEGFTEEYYNELLNRIKKYKNKKQE